jgi:hypothetical protein
MSNSNCLRGIRCPVCNQEGRFEIEVMGWAVVTDDGIDHGYDYDWTERSQIVCGDPNCKHHGTVKEFMTSEEK